MKKIYYLLILLLTSITAKSHLSAMDNNPSILQEETSAASPSHPQFPHIKITLTSEQAIEKIRVYVGRYLSNLQDSITNVKSNISLLSSTNHNDKKSKINLLGSEIQHTLEIFKEESLSTLKQNNSGRFKLDSLKNLALNKAINRFTVMNMGYYNRLLNTKGIFTDILDKFQNKDISQEQLCLYSMRILDFRLSYLRYMVSDQEAVREMAFLNINNLDYFHKYCRDIFVEIMNRITIYNKIIKTLIKCGITVEESSYLQCMETFKNPPLNKNELGRYYLDGAIFREASLSKSEMFSSTHSQISSGQINNLQYNLDHSTFFLNKENIVSDENIRKIKYEFEIKFQNSQKFLEMHIGSHGQRIKSENEKLAAETQLRLDQEKAIEEKTAFTKRSISNKRKQNINNRIQQSPPPHPYSPTNTIHQEEAPIKLPNQETTAKKTAKREENLPTSITTTPKPAEADSSCAPPVKKLTKEEKKTHKALERKMRLDKVISENKQTRNITPEVPEQFFKLKIRDFNFLEKILDPQTNAFTLNYERLRTTLNKLGILIPDTSHKGDYRKVYYVNKNNGVLAKDFIYKPATPTVGYEFLKTMREILGKFKIKIENISIS